MEARSGQKDQPEGLGCETALGMRSLSLEDLKLTRWELRLEGKCGLV